MSVREKYKRARQGDIAYNMMRMWQGAVGVAPVDGLISPAYIVAKPLPETDSRYYGYLYRIGAYKDEVNKFSRGIVSDRNRLYWEDFKQMPSPFPPPDEQAAIVRFLDHADRRIRRYIRAKRQLISLLNEQKQAIIHRAVTRGLDPNVRHKPSGVEWLGDVPEHCDVWQIGHLARVGNGSTPSRGTPEYWANRSYPWLNSSSVNQSTITSADQFVTPLALVECHLPRVQPGSVLVAITGQGKTRGTAARLMSEATINQDIAYITPRRKDVTQDFLYLALTAAYAELRKISDDAGSTKGALTCGDLKHFRIPVPPVDEQVVLFNSVENETSRASQLANHLEDEIKLITEYRTRLIADVVTGKLDVREAAARLPDELDDGDAEELIEDEGVVDDAEFDAEPEEVEV
jgi:type I restriction enzyme S subunit